MKRQSSLSELWHETSSKVPKHSEKQAFSSLKKKLDTKTWLEFQAELTAKQASEKAAADERLRRKALRESRKPGEIVDPSTKKQGVNESSNMGRKHFSFYKSIGNKKHKREFGGPILRRDRTAHEKLAVLVAVDSKCKGTKMVGKKVRADWDTLDRESKSELQRRFHGGCFLLYSGRSLNVGPHSHIRPPPFHPASSPILTALS